MKKEYIILILLIAALSAYLVFKKDDRSHYTLPTPPKVASDDVDRLVVKKKDKTLAFNKKDGKWTVTDKKFPADESAVDQMLDVVANLKVSALVSEKGDLVRYELDEENALLISAFKGETRLIAFKAGKAAPSYNHTFVQLADNPNVYHARQSFRYHFDKDPDDFRDKRVMDFPEESVQAVTLEKGGVVKTLTAKKAEPAKASAGEAPEDAGKDGKEQGPAAFVYEDDTPADKKALADLLDTLSALKCDSYPAGLTKKDLENQAPALKITLETDAKIVLNLFETPDDKEAVNGTSSLSDYAFSLQGYTAKDITTYVDTLLGIEKKKDQEKKPEE